MSDTINVLGFSGSLREGSYNNSLLRAAEELLPGNLRLEIFSLADIPLYDADIEASGWPSPVQAFRERVTAADALLIATPEYNYSVPGVLKNAIDWVSRPPDVPLANKPTAVMGATVGPYGTTRAQLHLRQILVFTGTPVMPGPQLLLAAARDKFDEQGRLTDEPTREQLSNLLKGLARWAARFRDYPE